MFCTKCIIHFEQFHSISFAYDRVYKLNHTETEKLHERMAIEHAQDQIRLSQGPKFRM